MIELGVLAPDVVDRSRPDPYYQQIKTWVLREIDSGHWPVHYRLPGEKDLARALGVSRGTLRGAIRELIAERRLVQIQGKGTFVTSPEHIEEPLADHLIAFSEELILQNIPFRTEVLDQRVVLPGPRIAAFLSLDKGEPVLYLRRRRFVDDVPIILTENYVPLAVAPGVEGADFSRQRLFECLENRHGLHLSWARRTFEAQLATPGQSDALALPPAVPVMYIEQIVYLADGRPAECSDIWLRSDHFRLTSIISRDGTVSRLANRARPWRETAR